MIFVDNIALARRKQVVNDGFPESRELINHGMWQPSQFFNSAFSVFLVVVSLSFWATRAISFELGFGLNVTHLCSWIGIPIRL